MLLIAITGGCAEDQPSLSSGTLRIGTTDVPYIVEGQGIPTLVTCDARLAQRVFSAELRDHLQFIFTDPRMFLEGVDSATLAPMTLDTIALDIERLRQHLRLDSMVVVGHSICGLFAVEYAKAYPERVSHIVMIGTPPGWRSDIWSAASEYWETNASEDRKAALARNQELVSEDSLSGLSPQAARWAGYVRATPQFFFDPDYDFAPLAEGVYYPVEGEDHLLENVMPGYEFPGPDTITPPIFLALGWHDYVVPPTVWDAIKPGFSNLTSVVFERSGHFPHFEEQALFDETLLEWLEGG
jgi:proline iminopeptidase